MSSLQKATLEEIHDAAAHICRDYLTGRWKTIDEERIIVNKLSGGLSNFLYHVSLPADDEAARDQSTHKRAHPDLVSHGDSNDESNSNSTNASKRQRTSCFGGASVGINSSQMGSAMSQEAEPKEVLLRIYGQTHGSSSDALEGMITESVVFALLSERNFGPKLLGIFPGGRIEQFIPARALKTKELSRHDISMKIAEKLGEIHSLNIPMSKEPDWLWNCMERWLKIVTIVLKQTNWKESDLPLVDIVRSLSYIEESKWLKGVIAQGKNPVLFCHNDLQEGNILFRENDALSSLRCNFERSAIASEETTNGDFDTNKRKRSTSPLPDNEDNSNNNYKSSVNDDSCLSDSIHQTEVTPELIIIDFEYCAYNYRGFDLANHFLEWTIDYTSGEYPFFLHQLQQYPTAQQRRDFISVYLRKLHENIESYDPSEEEILGVEEEIKLFSLFSHLFWSLWSVVNVSSNIEFGYWEYAVTRIREYQKLKALYIQSHGGSGTNSD